MSRRLISRSADLARLRDEGYDIDIVGGHLVLRQVPYLDGAGRVLRGALVSTLTLDAEATIRPDTHVVHFQGSEPCDRWGKRLARVINSACPGTALFAGMHVDFVLSSKPAAGYADYFDKMTTYVNLLSQHAIAVDPEATAQVFPVVPADAEDGPFAYTDTASSRAGIAALAAKLSRAKIAIVGVGGTGSYILDLVAKCPVAEIHLYDGDLLLQHNAFRYPGAVGIDELASAGNKAEHHAQRYLKMHRGVQAHPYPIDEHNCDELAEMDFVFVSVDDNPSRGCIAHGLMAVGVPFVDVGIGMQTRPSDSNGVTLGGSVRTTLVDCDPDREISARIPTAANHAGNEYEANIQIAEANALNAALAVIRWKRFVGIYDDLEHERHSVYDIDGNTITNDDHPDGRSEPNTN